MNFPSENAIFRWKPGAWLRATGPDAATFLQGQFTNDLRDRKIGQAVYGLWLNVKGKVLADSFVVRGADGEFWIGSYHADAAVLRERLESHIIADDVVIEDESPRWSAVTLFGENLGASALPRPEEPLGFAFPGRRARTPPLEWIFPDDAVETVERVIAGKPELTATEVERRRIEAGIPSVPKDIGPADLPNEGGLDADAISYTKGCYLGQEVMARLKSMGQVRRRLLRVAGAAPALPRLPTPVFAGGRQVGELRSAVATPDGLLGLALLTLMHVRPEQPLSLASDAAPALRLLDQP